MNHPTAWSILTAVLFFAPATYGGPTGACCDGQGGCEEVTAAECVDPGDRFIEGVGCDPYPCTLNYGHCCTPNGTPGCLDLHPGCFSPEGVLDIECATQCEQIVCAIDAKCCDPTFEWDGICADFAADHCLTPDGSDCRCSNPVPDPMDLGMTKADPCCFSLPIIHPNTPCAVPGRGCAVYGGDPTCEALVCAADSLCCNLNYDRFCAILAFDLCDDLCAKDGDCAVDTLLNHVDHAGFVDCVTGIGGGPVDGHCLCADLTVNGDVDLLDWGELQIHASGAAVP